MQLGSRRERYLKPASPVFIHATDLRSDDTFTSFRFNSHHNPILAPKPDQFLILYFAFPAQAICVITNFSSVKLTSIIRLHSRWEAASHFWFSSTCPFKPNHTAARLRYPYSDGSSRLGRSTITAASGMDYVPPQQLHPYCRLRSKSATSKMTADRTITASVIMTVSTSYVCFSLGLICRPHMYAVSSLGSAKSFINLVLQLIWHGLHSIPPPLPAFS